MIASLYEDWLQSGEDWAHSCIYQNSLNTKSHAKRGKEVMKPFKDLCETFGLALAKSIRERKYQLQQTKKPMEPDWVQKHPEVPDDKDIIILL